MSGAGWVDQSYVQYANSADTTGTVTYTGPNGSPFDNSGKFTQTQRYDSYKAWVDNAAAQSTGANRIAWDAAQYEDWEKMHDGAIWFDTAGCKMLTGPHIGQANTVNINPLD